MGGGLEKEQDSCRFSELRKCSGEVYLPMEEFTCREERSQESVSRSLASTG